MDLADPAAIERADDPHEALVARSELRGNELDEALTAQTRARNELADVEARLREVREARESLRWSHRDQRTEFDDLIRCHERAADHWRQRFAELDQARELAGQRVEAFVEEHGQLLADDPRPASAQLHDAIPPAELDLEPRAPIEPADAGMDLGL